MSKNHLGEFEEIVMLTVAILHGEAYGIAILDEIEDRLNRKVSFGSLQNGPATTRGQRISTISIGRSDRHAWR